MSWLPLKIKKEEYERQEAELRAGWGNVPIVDEAESSLPADIEVRLENTDKLLKGRKK